MKDNSTNTLSSPYYRTLSQVDCCCSCWISQFNLKKWNHAKQITVLIDCSREYKMFHNLIICIIFQIFCLRNGGNNKHTHRLFHQPWNTCWNIFETLKCLITTEHCTSCCFVVELRKTLKPQLTNNCWDLPCGVYCPWERPQQKTKNNFYFPHLSWDWHKLVCNCIKHRGKFIH